MGKCERIELTSPFPFESLPRVWRWIEPFRAKVADDFAPQNLGDFVNYMAEKWNRQRTWAVYGEGELGGLITFEPLSPWVGTAHVILKPDFQGRGIAVKACRQAVEAMFQQPGLGKLAFFILAGNLAIGSLLVGLGAKREGKLEGHTLCGGKPTTMWAYGLTKQDFEVKYNAVSSAGNPGNHRGSVVDHRVGPIGNTEDEHPDEQQREQGRVDLQ